MQSDCFKRDTFLFCQQPGGWERHPLEVFDDSDNPLAYIHFPGQPVLSCLTVLVCVIMFFAFPVAAIWALSVTCHWIGVGSESTTARRWFGPGARFRSFRPAPGTDLCGQGHVPGHLIIITDARWPGDVASELRGPPVFCGLTGRNLTQSLQTRAARKESPLNSLFPPCRLRSVGGNQISYQCAGLQTAGLWCLPGVR